MGKKENLLINNLKPTKLLSITKYPLKICNKNNEICKIKRKFINFTLLPQKNQRMTKV